MGKQDQGKTVLVPPDGGWAWVVCFAFGFNNVVVIPVMQNFGLIVMNKFAEIGLSNTDIALIINSNSAFGMMMGLFNGSLLKKFGFRKISVLGGILNAGGLILTSFANSFATFFITYGLITSLGMGLTWSSFSLALNSYFKKRRSLATGLGMTITGIGPIIMPLFITFLLDQYGVSGTILIISGISLHTLVAASLLQPLKWHMKKEIVDCEMVALESKEQKPAEESLLSGENEKQDPATKTVETNLSKKHYIGSTISIDHDVDAQSIYGFETPLPSRKHSQASYNDTTWHKRKNYSRSVSQPEYYLHRSNLSIDSVNSLKSIKEESKEKNGNESNEKLACIEENSMNQENKEENACWRYTKAVIYFFDLDLLKDPIYLNIMLGLSVAIFAEINFSLLTPFIMKDFGYTPYETAKIMSVIAISDIIFRFLGPFIGDCMKQPPKIMYMGSLTVLILGRTGLIFTNSFAQAVGIALVLGIGKGFRSVFMPLVIPSYVPLERLASASGLQMVTNGICILLGGSIIGVIRDATGSYSKCIIVLNCMTFITIVMWMSEYLYMKFKKN